MKRIWYVISFVVLMMVLVSCGINQPERDTEKQVEDTQETEILEFKNSSNAETNEEIERVHWVVDLQVAEKTNQIIAVVAEGNSAVVSVHNKNEDGVWEEVLATEASIGKNGVGKTQEGDGKTPRGEYRFTFGFGIKADPGTVFSYTQVDDTYYWVDDSDSQYYNQFVSTKDVSKDWNSAEHIMSAEESYHYVLATNYNEECIPGAGSAIFMHCKPTGGAGCIAVSEESMIEIMKIVQPDCVLIIDDTSNIHNY